MFPAQEGPNPVGELLVCSVSLFPATREISYALTMSLLALFLSHLRYARTVQIQMHIRYRLVAAPVHVVTSVELV